MFHPKAQIMPQIIATVVMSIGAYAHGSTLGWTSNITKQLQNGELNGLNMGRNELSITASCLTLGAMLSCLCIGFIADAKGRRVASLVTVLPFTTGWLLILVAIDVRMVYVGRFLTGIGGGAFNVIAPIYTSEIAQIHIRGSLGTVTLLFTGLGVLHGNVLGWALPLIYFNIACLSIPIIFAALFWFQPETPVYYLQKGNFEEGKKVFARLRGKDYDPSVEMKYYNIELSGSPSKTSILDFYRMLNTKSQIKATIICFGLMFFQQFSGINAVVFYTDEIFTHSRAPIPTHFAVILVGAVGFLGMGLSVWLIDRIGRTILLKCSSALSAVALFLFGFFYTMKVHMDADEDILQAAYFLPLMALILFLLSFNLGLGPVPWISCSELLAAAVKAKLSSIIGAFNWLLAFLITRFYFFVSYTIGVDITFYVFSSVTILCFFFVLLFMPETKNRRYIDLKLDLETIFND